MAARTIENCSIIKKCVKAGIGEPTQYYNIKRCEGYAPFEQCKKCKYHISYEKEQ